jgi:hypothetical protein
VTPDDATRGPDRPEDRTLKDVAARAGMSISTTDQVLNGFAGRFAGAKW